MEFMRSKRLAVLALLVLVLAASSLFARGEAALAASPQEYQVNCQYGQGCFLDGYVSRGSYTADTVGYDQNGRVITMPQFGSCNNDWCFFEVATSGYVEIAWSYIEIQGDGYIEGTASGCTGNPAPPQNRPAANPAKATGGATRYVAPDSFTLKPVASPAPH